MTVAEIIGLINDVGFPIVVCGGLMWYIKDRDEKLNITIGSMRDVVIEVKQMLQDIRTRGDD